MKTFAKWRANGRAFDPDYAEKTFDWRPLTQDVRKVFVYPGPVFIEILNDDTPIFGGVAMESLQMAEEAAYQWLRAREVA